jgi:hypothetical protein
MKSVSIMASAFSIVDVRLRSGSPMQVNSWVAVEGSQVLATGRASASIAELRAGSAHVADEQATGRAAASIAELPAASAPVADEQATGCASASIAELPAASAAVADEVAYLAMCVIKMYPSKKGEPNIWWQKSGREGLRPTSDCRANRDDHVDIAYP